ncbi:MAG: sugar phosphate isomerase/epimerase [Deltaproteobacteria bacterium]|nr:MAG: sugar phosphate isomerase/epimerase [Deltaproteobacteria bacterium]
MGSLGAGKTGNDRKGCVMRKPIVSVNTLAFEGYDLSITVKVLAELGIQYVEFAFIKGYSEGLSESTFSAATAKFLKKLLDEYGLKMVALAAHLDLGLKESVEAFKRRMDFAGRLGVNIILTNSSTQENRTTFLHNIDKLAVRAESLGITIGLENPGDGTNNLIGSGEQGAKLIKEINSPFVRLNYDVGNTYSYSKGTIKPENDIQYAYPCAIHFHFKDTKPDENGWVFSEIGRGVINYKEIIEFIKVQPEYLPIGLEMPLSVRRDKEFKPQKVPVPPSLSEIKRTVKQSYDFTLRSLAGINED